MRPRPAPAGVVAGSAPRPAATVPAARLPHAGRLGALALSLGALGVVYGDIGTSPLYTMQLVFTLHPLAPTATHVYGAISLIFWSLIMVVTLKYVLLILRADNHGEGGIMALVALIERCVQGRRRTALIMVGILGASLFYGDGMLTPAISVVSAVSGLQVASPALAAQIVPFSLAILVALFALQRFGTGTIGVLFGPIMLIWFAVLAFIGTKQVLLHPDIVKALSPSYGASFLFGEPSAGFLSLASVFLAVTGAESIYADMGHFGRPAITRAWLAVALPALVLNYLGQGALILAAPAHDLEPVLPDGAGRADGADRHGDPGHGGDGDRLAGGHLGRLLGDPAAGAARLPAADLDPPHVEADHGPDLHPARELVPAGGRGHAGAGVP